MKNILFLLICFFSSLHAEENKILVCENSREMLEWAEELISHAEQSIEFAPCFFGGDVAQELLTCMEKRMQCCSKLKIYMLISTLLLEPQDKAILNRLSKEYSRQFHITYTVCVVDVAGDIRLIDNHVKALIVDEKYFIVGGTNYDDRLCSEGTFTPPKRSKECTVGGQLQAGSRDQDVVGKGPLARDLRLYLHHLFALWNDYAGNKKLTPYDPWSHAVYTFFEISPENTAQILRFDCHPRSTAVAANNIRMVTSGPMDRHNPITQEYARLIRGAQEEVIIGNHLFSPVSSIFEALLYAVNHHVKLTVITNGAHENSPFSTHVLALANRLFYFPVMYGKSYSLFSKPSKNQSNIQTTHVFEYDVFDVLYHKKVMVIDEKILVVGSYNLGIRSDNADYEIVLVIDSAPLARDLKEVLQRDISHSREVLPPQAYQWYFDPLMRYRAEIQQKGHSVF